ncbi:MAG TPA: tetratricopeptide repeat protein, partial [Cyclobacteriaceae bacterium]|nr:tetratricopeptide repeat protein [Cyclobacteriaceae bacterium]
QGYFNEAIEILQTRERYFAGRALRQESYVDEKGSLKSRKLTESEIDVRYNEYAKLLTLLGYSYGQQGNLKSADSAFVFASTWIRKNLSNTSLAYIKNQYYNANILTENGNETLPRELEYGGLLNDLKAKHKPSHYIAVSLYESFLRQLTLGENYKNYARFLNTRQEFERMINSSYPSLSTYNVRLKAVDFDSKLGGDKTKGLENEANNLLANSKGLSHYNTTTIRVLRFLYDLDMQTKNFSAAEKQLSDIIEIKTELYGIDAPETHLARLQLANFYLDNTNKIAEANKIYDESYIKIVSKQIGAWHKDHLDILNHMGALYELTDKYKEASATLDKATEVARSKYSDTDYQYGVELNNIARLAIRLGLYEKAEENVNKSLKILEDLRKDEAKNIYLIQAIETQAILFGIKGMFDEAEDALNQTAKIIRKSENLVMLDELTAQKELSGLQIQLGRYARVEDLLSVLIPSYEKQYGANSIHLIEPLVDWGLLTLAQGDYTEAEKIAQRANQIALSVYGEKSTKTAPTQRLLSDIYYTIGDYEKAESNLEKAVASQENQFGRNHIEVAKSLSQLSLIRFYKGEKLADVEKVMLEALDIMGKRLGKDNPQYAEIL